MNNQKQKKPLPLNFPSNEDQFELVPFVHNMSEYKLKVFIKRMWMNLQELANMLDYRRKDISKVIDGLLDGQRFDKKSIEDRYFYGYHKGFIIKVDTLTKRIIIMDQQHNPVENPIQGLTLTEIKQRAKDRRKRMRV